MIMQNLRDLTVFFSPVRAVLPPALHRRHGSLPLRPDRLLHLRPLLHHSPVAPLIGTIFDVPPTLGQGGQVGCVVPLVLQGDTSP